MQGGDLLLFVTDGVFERPGTSWDESLLQLASTAAATSRSSVERIADEVIDSINDDASARDDRALVVVKVPDRIGRGPAADGAAAQADDAGRNAGDDGHAAPDDRLAADPQSSLSSESPISHSIGGHRPTNSARRSALPRSS